MAGTKRRLNRLLYFSSLKGERIDVDLAKEALKSLLEAETNIITVEKIQKIVSYEYKIQLSKLKSKNNSPVVAFPRQIAMYLSKELTRASLPEIGKKFGGKHHTTVLHSIRKIEKLREKDLDFNKKINKIIGYIR